MLFKNRGRMIHETPLGKVEAVPVKGEMAIYKLRGKLASFLKSFDVDMQSFNRNRYLVFGRFIEGDKKDEIAFVFVRKCNSVIEFFAESSLRNDRQLYELALRVWKENFKIS